MMMRMMMMIIYYTRSSDLIGISHKTHSPLDQVVTHQGLQYQHLTSRHRDHSAKDDPFYACLHTYIHTYMYGMRIEGHMQIHATSSHLGMIFTHQAAWWLAIKHPNGSASKRMIKILSFSYLLLPPPCLADDDDPRLLAGRAFESSLNTEFLELGLSVIGTGVAHIRRSREILLHEYMFCLSSYLKHHHQKRLWLARVVYD